MSKLDWFTILVIAVCILAIGALIWNAKNLYQGSNNPADTEISEDYDDSAADLSEDDTYDINIDGDADGDNAVATNGTSNGKGGTINYDTEIAREAAEADAEEARMAEREAAEAAARENSAVSERINTNTSPSTQNSANAGNTATRQAATRNSEGAFMVIIGSYKQMISAERMLRTVKSKGYGNATIKKFDNGTYARILVGRRKTLNSARDLQAELISDGFQDVIIEEK